MYFNTEDYDKAVEDLSNDAVYDEILLNGGGIDENPVPVIQAVPLPQQDSFTKRRYKFTLPPICLKEKLLSILILGLNFWLQSRLQVWRRGLSILSPWRKR